jgi:hypothetical protein
VLAAVAQAQRTMSDLSVSTKATLQPSQSEIQVGSGQSKGDLQVSSESPKPLSSNGGHSIDEPTSSSQNVSKLSVSKDSVPSLVRRDSSSSLSHEDSDRSLQHQDSSPKLDSRGSGSSVQQQDSGRTLQRQGARMELPVLPRHDSDDDLSGVQRRDSQDELQNVRGPNTYKTKDLHISDEASTRLGKTIAKREAKQQKLQTDKTEARKDFKSRFDKFLKEFKSVFKNTGKLSKAIGDTGKGVREAVVTGDKSRLGGFDSAGMKDANKTALSGEAGVLKDVGIGFTVIGGVTQLVETGADIYLFKGKVDKAKTDEQTMTGFAQTVKELHDAREELNSLMTDQVKALNTTIQDARDAGIDDVVIQSLEQQRNGLLGGGMDRVDVLQQEIATLTQKMNDTFAAFKLAEGDYDKFHQDLALELTKLYKSVGDGTKALIDISRLAMASGTALAEGFKAASGTVGAIIGPVTFGVNLKDMITDIDGNVAALRMKKVTSGAIKGKEIHQKDAELLAISERIRLKQKKQSVDKGLSATKSAFGALGGLASGVAGAATIAAMATTAAVGVAAIATPVGWALAGTAALAAIGYGIYKLARHINSSGIKAALQGSIQTLDKQNDDNTTLGQMRAAGLTKKEGQQLDRVAKKAVEALKSQGVTKTPDQLTVGELRDYACKKLLARDTGIATTSLYHRFRDEVTAEFGKPFNQVSKQELEDYLQQEGSKDVADSAMSLMSKLGVSLKAEDALMLLRTGDKGESSGIKFLSKKLKLA